MFYFSVVSSHPSFVHPSIHVVSAQCVAVGITSAFSEEDKLLLLSCAHSPEGR